MSRSRKARTRRRRASCVYLAEHLARIVPEIAEESVSPDVFRFVVLAVPIDREPVDRRSVGSLTIAVAHVMARVELILKHLGESHGHRFQKAESEVQRTPAEIRIVDEIVRDAADVPVDRHRVNQTEQAQEPPRRRGKNVEEEAEIGAMSQRRHDGNGVQTRVGKEAGAFHRRETIYSVPAGSYSGAREVVSGESRATFEALPRLLHLNLDHAWADDFLALPSLDATDWGPRLRFSAPARLIEKFYREYEGRLAPFLVYGSGDFHHLTALWLRQQSEPFVLIAFDNHPDWDLRPPHWCCGGWINRALELPQLRKAIVWGCGNFETWWPAQIFGNRRAENDGTLELHAWADDRPARERARRGAILRENWREMYTEFVRGLSGARLYVTVDLDCLRAEDAATNWENGRFTLDDVVWAIELLGQKNRIVAGDICGAWSPALYARWKQRFASEMDHPKLPLRDPAEIRRINEGALLPLLSVLTLQAFRR